jgi:hypothetical protein
MKDQQFCERCWAGIQPAGGFFRSLLELAWPTKKLDDQSQFFVSRQPLGRGHPAGLRKRFN